MGTAILTVRGTLPPTTIELALKAPIHLPLPMAPPEGLVLVNAGFGLNSNDQVGGGVAEGGG